MEKAGVPLIGEAGIGYNLVEALQLPSILFTKEETKALFTAEKLVEKFTDYSYIKSY